ncbi:MULTISPECIES: hypothetical protein [Halorussus]|nr:hypothetical protein [Halorussus vallis]USZ77296.1 hypothetical protein NGM07_08185 [Halorussus vallis]
MSLSDRERPGAFEVFSVTAVAALDITTAFDSESMGTFGTRNDPVSFA